MQTKTLCQMQLSKNERAVIDKTIEGLHSQYEIGYSEGYASARAVAPGADYDRGYADGKVAGHLTGAEQRKEIERLGRELDLAKRSNYREAAHAAEEEVRRLNKEVSRQCNAYREGYTAGLEGALKTSKGCSSFTTLEGKLRWEIDVRKAPRTELHPQMAMRDYYPHHYFWLGEDA